LHISEYNLFCILDYIIYNKQIIFRIVQFKSVYIILD